jgi:Malic enzyme
VKGERYRHVPRRRVLLARRPSGRRTGIASPVRCACYDGNPSSRPRASRWLADQEIRAASLEYHRQSPPGKISVTATKHLTNQHDLGLAYTPGVAAACDEIVRDPAEARNLTARGNLIGVVTNGTAVLGLGAIGPLAPSR